MAPFVCLLIVWNMDFPIALCGNDRFCTSFIQSLAQMIGIKSLVSHQCIERETINQIGYTDDLAALTGKQFEPDKIAQGISESQYFGRQSAF